MLSPSNRFGASGFFDGSNNLHIFGGYTSSFTPKAGFLSDHWTFNTQTSTFQLVPNSKKGPNWSSNYCSSGVADVNTKPGGRTRASSFVIGANLYLFGGYGFGNSAPPKYLNDLFVLRDYATPVQSNCQDSSTQESIQAFPVTQQPQSSSGISMGMVIGVVAAVAAVCIVVGVVLFLRWKRKSSSDPEPMSPQSPKPLVANGFYETAVSLSPSPAQVPAEDCYHDLKTTDSEEGSSKVEAKRSLNFDAVL